MGLPVAASNMVKATSRHARKARPLVLLRLLLPLVCPRRCS